MTSPPDDPEELPFSVRRGPKPGPSVAVLSQIERWLGLADGEGGRATRLLALVFTLSSALVLLKAAQSGIFLAAYPKAMIPWAFAVSAVTLATLSLLSVPMAARLGPVRLTSWTLGTAAASLLLLWGLLWAHLPHAPFALYVVIEAFCGLLLIQVWSVVSEATNARSAKRLLPVAGVGATMAWTVVGLLVPGITHLTGAPGLLLLAPLLLLGCLGLVRAVASQDLSGESRMMVRRAPMLQEWKEGFSFVRDVPLMRIMALLSVLSLVSEQLMDYQMMAAARERYGAPSAVASFFGTYYGITSAISLLSLLSVSGRTLASLGASRSLLLVPSVAALGAFAATLFPSFWPVVLMRASDRVLKQSLWSSASEQTQTPLPVLRRAQARALIRGVIAPAGYAVAALGLAALPPSFENRWLALATAVVCTIMAALIFLEVRRAYQRALQQALDDRKLDLRGNTSSPLDADACAALVGELHSPDPRRAALATELLRANPTQAAAEALLLALEHPTATVRLLAVEGLEKRPIPSTLGTLRRLVREDHDPQVRKAALRALRGYPEARSVVEGALEDPEPSTAAAARVTLALLEAGSSAVNGTLLLPLLKSGELIVVREALGALAPACGDVPEVLEQLRELLLHGPIAIRREVLQAVTRLRLSALIPTMMKLLEDPDLAAEVAASLTEWSSDAVVPLEVALGQERQEHRLVAGLIAMAPGASVGTTIILRLLSHTSSSVRERATRVISRVVREGKRPPLGAAVAPLLDQELASAYRLSCVLGGLAHDDGTPDWEIEPTFAFLAGEVERRILQARARVLHLLALMGNARMVWGVEFGLRRTSAAIDAKVAELLELVLEPGLAKRVVPLFERLSLREQAEIARKLGVLDEGALQDPMQTLVNLEDDHLLGCAAWTYGNRFAERFPKVYEGLAPVLPLFERMTFLRSVPLFSELSGEDLRSVAEIVEYVDFPSEATIFRKGDPGEDLYLIVEGRVAIRDGKVELNQLGEREFFGELAVLDREPRSADVVCLCDTRLLRLRGADLGELMARRPPICEQILLVLVRRLRALTQRVAQ
ncbi:MAG: cyclic nucleotide-binding domain-containing protein [Myxococcales bacterium]|nr:cyclic nucleotide-binding domain-containing protein [Polyangiaceae bacterium]MDW8248017.1 cyclic nucleotide-binding domain-containing protein [Myxococcales bacterium]